MLRPGCHPGWRDEYTTRRSISETTFAAFFGRRLHFITDDQGVVTHLVFEAPEPHLADVTADRRSSGRP
jgi:hypothetical protein